MNCDLSDLSKTFINWVPESNNLRATVFKIPITEYDTCQATMRRPWRSRSPSRHRLIWRRKSWVALRWWTTWGWSWWARWWHRGPPWRVSHCGSARSWPRRWWLSDQMECRSGWGSSPWNERTESRKPGESSFLVTTQ